MRISRALHAPDRQHSGGDRLKEKLAGLPAACEVRARNGSEAVTATDEERQYVIERLRRGRGDPTALEGQPISDIVLGIDFGSTSTKIVARLPYHAGSPAAAMPVPLSARAEHHPNLWFSRLWLDPQEHHHLLQVDGAAPLCALKTRLVFSASSDQEAHAAAFLGQLIAFARDWSREYFEPIARSTNFRWSYNFGFPADSLDQSDLADRYLRVIATALELSRSQPSTLIETRVALSRIGDARKVLEAYEASIQPEVAAVVAAAAEATRLPRGLFMMMDVGGVTLDCCTFKLIPTADGDERMPIYRASVETLGSECEAILQDDPQALKDLRQAVLTQLRSVVVDTYQDYMRGNRCWQGRLPLLLVGGGAAHNFYSGIPGHLDSWLSSWLRREGCPGVTIFRNPHFDGVAHDGTPEDMHRLGVAIGLSKPSFEIPVVTLRQSIPPLPPQRDYKVADRYVGPEMT